MIEEGTFVVRLSDGSFVPVAIESEMAMGENEYCIQSNNSSQNIAIKVEPISVLNRIGIVADANNKDSIVSIAEITKIIDSDTGLSSGFPYTFPFELEG